MRRIDVRRTGALIFAGALSATAALADHHGAEKAAAPQPTPEEKAYMEKWNKFMTPGEPHRLLAQKAGTWDMKTTMWMVPGGPPETSTGTSELKMVLDGRFLEDVTTSEFQGQPFHGRGLTGYDNIKQKFVTTWYDNFGTGVMVFEGDYDAANKRWTYTGAMPDVASWSYLATRSTETATGPDSLKVEWFAPGPDGKEFKSMEIVYTRRK